MHARAIDLSIRSDKQGIIDAAKTEWKQLLKNPFYTTKNVQLKIIFN